MRLLELFALAAREQLEIHPAAMRAATRDAALIDRKVRDDPRANALFMEVLTCVHAPELVLRWMNEAGVFGRFVPDFGRVVAQMQFDMYHHYTVDEHSIRAIGLLAAIERGELKPRTIRCRPRSFKQIASRRVLYVAVLLHDIAKGRGGDHSVIGAEIALEARARASGSIAAETETVVLAGPLSPADVVDRVQARPRRPQDDRGFRPPGAKPGAAAAAADPDRRRHPRGRAGRLERVEADAAADLVRSRRGAASARPQAARPERAGRAARRRSWPRRSAGRRARRAPMPGGCPTAIGWPSRWPGRSPTRARSPPPKRASAMPGRASSPRTIADSGATRVSVFTPDREGLFYRICAGLAAAGANIIDARIHTTRDGMALDNLLVLDGRGQPYSDRRLREPAGQVGRGRADQPATPPPLPAAEPQRRTQRRSRSRRRSRSPTAPRPGRRWSRSMRATGRRCSPGWRAAIHALRPPHPFGAYRDLWRARGRRLLPDRAPTARSSSAERDRAPARRPARRRRASAGRARKPPHRKGPAASAGPSLDFSRWISRARRGAGGGGGGGGGGRRQPAAIDRPAAAAEPAAAA